MHFQWKILFFGFFIYLDLSNGQHGEGKAPPDPAARIAKGISSLGSKLVTSLEADSTPNENLLISPANIFHAMALLHMAAGGNTLKELSTLMGIPPNRNYSKIDLHSATSAFYKNITNNDKHAVTISIADALFLQNGFQIKKEYQDFAVKQYEAQVGNVDFRAEKEALDKINGWASEKTRNRIPKVVDKISPDTQAVIVTTLFFNATWTYPFKKEKTYKGKFSTGENEIEVQMMNLTKYFQYVDNTELQFESIDLPYAGSDYAMNIILPYPNQTIKDILPKLKNISLTDMMAKGSHERVNVELPKTKFHVDKSLVKNFQQLGVQELFTGANLTDLTDASLRISKIFHSAEIEINEAGTTATAATVFAALFVSLPIYSTSPIPFHVNRPFIINIYNKETSMNLFSGIIYKPVVAA